MHQKLKASYATHLGFSANFLANSHGHASESKRSLWEAAQSESPDARKLMR